MSQIFSAAGNAVSGLLGSSGAQSAASTQATADLQAQSNANAILQPFVSAGSSALPALQAGVAPGGQFNSPYTMSDFQQDPGYQFDLNQGNLAIQRSAASQGMLDSGGTLKQIGSYTQNMASNEFQNAYQRFMNTRQLNFQNLGAVAGMGQQSAAGQATNAFTGTTAAGTAQAAGTVGSTNALTGAIGNTVNTNNQFGLLQALQGGGGGTGTYGGISSLLSSLGIGGSGAGATAGGVGEGLSGAFDAAGSAGAASSLGDVVSSLAPEAIALAA